MATRRAKRLAKYLENAGWDVYDVENSRRCPRCDAGAGDNDFCPNCGHKTRKNPGYCKPSHDLLERAIGHALEEE